MKNSIDSLSGCNYNTCKKSNGCKERKGTSSVEMAKVTSKGQITIPVSIRKRLDIREGDKLLFIDTPDGVVMVNPETREAAREGDAAAETGADMSGGVQKTVTVMTDVSAERDEYVHRTEKKEPAPQAGGFDVVKLLDEIRSFKGKY